MSLTIKVADIGYKQDNSNNFETFNGFFGGATPSATDIISENELSTNTTWSSLKIKTELDKKKPFLLVDSLPEEGEPDTVYIIKNNDKTKSYIYSGEWIPFYSNANIAKLIVTTDAGATVYATNGSVTYSAVAENGVAELMLSKPGIYTVYAEKDGERTVEETVEVSQTVFNVEAKNFMPVAKPILNDNSWEAISVYSQEGLASSLWNIGDTKTITLSGTCLGQNISGQYKVYIIDFNHNSSIEGNGITFGTFKSTSGTDIALVKASSSGGLSTTAYYNMGGSNKTNGDSTYGTNYLGWKNTFMRYNILGSTDNFTLNSTSANFDASTNTAISPKSDTLMSCLPSDLRAVMKPMTIYTDNQGQKNNNSSSAVSATIDYLPLLSEYEVQGTRTYANSNEQSKQAQYSYYKNGNSKIKYQHTTGSAWYWWLRSPYYNNINAFCCVNDDGNAYFFAARTSLGVAPIFKV